MNFEEEKSRRIRAKEPPFLFSISTPADKQYLTRILGGVRLPITTGNHCVSIESIFYGSTLVKRKTNSDQKFLDTIFFNDAIDDKDLQRVLILIERHCALATVKTGSEIIKQCTAMEKGHPRFYVFSINCMLRARAGAKAEGFTAIVEMASLQVTTIQSLSRINDQKLFAA